MNKGNAKNNTQFVFGGRAEQKNEEGSAGNTVYNFRECNSGESRVDIDGTNTKYVACHDDIKNIAESFLNILTAEETIMKHMNEIDSQD